MLALTLGLSTVALATIQSGYDVGLVCSKTYGYGTAQWNNCIVGECDRLHDYLPISDPGVQACIAKARKPPVIPA